MTLSKELHDLSLTDDEKKLRDGIFNMNTRRFGKVAEFMIAKLYNFSIVYGTTKYDLKSGTGMRIEVKFSRVEHTEENMNLENCLRVCMENANPTSRRISYIDFLKKGEIRFDRNIEQIKAYEFDRLYYGLFFEDQIAIFSMSSEEIKDIMTAQFFISSIKSPKPSVDKAIELVKKFPKGKGEIPKTIDKIRGKLLDIESSSNQYAEKAKDYIVKNDMIDPWNSLIFDIETNGFSLEQQLERIQLISTQYVKFCHDEFGKTGRFPDVSPFQHRGNDKAEGQMHINNENLRWHIEKSGFFCGWLSYKDLYMLLV